jgi:hypothetical protein
MALSTSACVWATVLSARTEAHVVTTRRRPPTAVLLTLFGAACVGGALLGVWSARRELQAAASVELDPVLATGDPGGRIRGRRAGAGLPSFMAQRTVETRPGYPGYDPMRLGTVLAQSRIFEQEPRKEPWAGQLESALRTGIASDLARIVPGLEVQDIECRTTICRLRWEKPEGVPDRKVFALLRVLYAGAGGGSGARDNEIFLTYAGGVLQDIDTGDVPKLLASLKNVRKRRLAWIRRLASRGEQRFPEVLPTEWPPE